jgi:hypothetical protein
MTAPSALSEFDRLSMRMACLSAVVGRERHDKPTTADFLREAGEFWRFVETGLAGKRLLTPEEIIKTAEYRAEAERLYESPERKREFARFMLDPVNKFSPEFEAWLAEVSAPAPQSGPAPSEGHAKAARSTSAEPQSSPYPSSSPKSVQPSFSPVVCDQHGQLYRRLNDSCDLQKMGYPQILGPVVGTIA